MIGLGIGIPQMAVRGRGASGPSWAIDYDASRAIGPLLQLPAGSTFTRASTVAGTDHLGRAFTGKSGEIVEIGKRRVENLSVNAGGWTANAATISESAEQCVDGDPIPLYRFADGSGSGQHGAFKTSVAVPIDTRLVYSVYVRPDEISVLSMRLMNSSSTINVANGIFDLSLAEVASITGDGEPLSGIEAVDGGYRCWMSATTPYSTVNLFINMAKVTTGSLLYAGTVGEGFFIGGLQLEVVAAEQTEPNDYVSRGVLSAPYHGWNVDGVRYFNTDEAGDLIPAATMEGILFDSEKADSLVINVPDGEYDVAVTYGNGTGATISETASSGMTLNKADFGESTVKKLRASEAAGELGLLMESGDALLLESGDAILLED